MARRRKKLDLNKLYDEAYKNANYDRRFASNLLDKVKEMLEDVADADSFSSLGSVAARLMEKCGDSNKQIIKIAEILQNTENVKKAESSGSLTEEEIDMLQQKLQDIDDE